MLLFWLVATKKVFEPPEQTIFLLFLFCSFNIFFLNLLVLLNGGASRHNFNFHNLSLIGVSELEGYAALGKLEHIESISDRTIILLEAVVYCDLKGQRQRIHVVNPQEFGLKLSVHIELQDAYQVRIA